MATVKPAIHHGMTDSAALWRTAAAPAETISDTITHIVPLRRRRRSGKVGRFQRRSMRPRRSPIQTTGCASPAKSGLG